MWSGSGLNNNNPGHHGTMVDQLGSHVVMVFPFYFCLEVVQVVLKLFIILNFVI